MEHQCYGCVKPEHGDRVRDSSGQLGYGTLWVIDGDMAFVAFSNVGGQCRTFDVRLRSLEFVSREAKIILKKEHA